jgi:hypothetical protein
LWVIYLIPWRGPAPLDTAKPTLIAVAFVLLAQRLRVGSWPVVLAFCISFFLVGALQFYLGGGSEEAPDQRVLVTIVGSLLFSPVSLWGPVALGAIAFYFARRWWPDARAESAVS